MFVPNFKILGQVVAEKSLTKIKLTHTHPHSHTNGKNKKYIPPIYFANREYNNGYIYVYNPGVGADNPLGSFVLFTVLFSQYSPLLQVFLY